MTIFFYVLIIALLLLAVVKLISRLAKSKTTESLEKDFQILEIQVPRNNEDQSSGNESALAAEGMFAALHGLLTENSDDQEHFSFEIAFSGNGGIRFYVAAPLAILKFVESQIYAQYPRAIMKLVEDYTQSIPEGNQFEVVSFVPIKEVFFPIKSFRDFEVDPLSGITSSLSELADGEQVWLQLLAMPVPDGWQADGYAYIESIKTGSSYDKSFKLGQEFSEIIKAILNEVKEIVVEVLTSVFAPPQPATAGGYVDKPKPVELSSSQELEVTAIENKLSKMGFCVQMRVLSTAQTPERIQSNFRALTASFNQFYSSYTNSFRPTEVDATSGALEEFRARFIDSACTHILTVEELATVFHLPSSELGTPNISWLYSKKSEPPPTLPTSDCTYMGETIFRSKQVRFGLKNGDDRLRHMYLIGKSGTGKSTLLETMITQDIKNGFGVGVLDPHGETIDKVLDHIPDERLDDVVIVDPSDSERPVGLNLLEMEDLSQKNLMASALVSAIKQHFDYSWGPRLEYLLNYCLLTLLEVPGTTMLGITRLLEDDNYLKYILHFVKDPMVQKFWDSEYKAMKGNQKLVTEAIAPIQNKVNRFLASTTIRNILGQRNSTIDIWNIMNDGKILLMNLSKGKVGEDNANLLGALLVSRIQFMALQRARIPYEDRRPFYLYVDEFQNFATGSFETILSESRKYKLGLYLTHQYTAQLPEELLKAVFGNVGTIATFSLGAPDAKALANEFAPFFDDTDIISLERFHIYLKLMIDGMTSLPFSARILLPWDPRTCVVPKTPNKQKVLELSRQKYGVDNTYVEDKVHRWLDTRFDKGMAIAEEQRKLKDKEV